ncbi:hypothetical protein PoB_005422900 [Plakobranchus ocellatus]|uniref:Uncharacterized protein n=1 Tax=Plakobranchus ocellatus TaxID=259542 RepID=A0AAV4C590_9GAST|nr:hypothetical protein PoB_005422900 [Plakobranchus ocellatus]
MSFNIEDEMKRFGNFYDFNDFVSCVRKAKSIPIIMKPQDFRAWQSGVSHHTPNRLPKRQELVTMVQVIFQRGRENLLFKISFAGVEREPQIEPNSHNHEVCIQRRMLSSTNCYLSYQQQGRRSGISCP